MALLLRKVGTFCSKHILYQNHRIDDANVRVTSIYDDNWQYQLWRVICENFTPKHISIKFSLFLESFLIYKTVFDFTAVVSDLVGAVAGVETLNMYFTGQVRSKKLIRSDGLSTLTVSLRHIFCYCVHHILEHVN